MSENIWKFGRDVITYVRIELIGSEDWIFW